MLDPWTVLIPFSFYVTIIKSNYLPTITNKNNKTCLVKL